MRLILKWLYSWKINLVGSVCWLKPWTVFFLKSQYFSVNTLDWISKTVPEFIFFFLTAHIKDPASVSTADFLLLCFKADSLLETCFRFFWRRPSIKASICSITGRQRFLLQLNLFSSASLRIFRCRRVFNDSPEKRRGGNSGLSFFKIFMGDGWSVVWLSFQEPL